MYNTYLYYYIEIVFINIHNRSQKLNIVIYLLNMSIAIGLNSGSSVDSVDVAIIETEIYKKLMKPIKVLKHFEFQWPDNIKKLVLNAIEFNIKIPEFSRLNTMVGSFFGETINMALKESGLNSTDIDVIGYDGQTIYQEPPLIGKTDKNGCKLPVTYNVVNKTLGTTLQIGESAMVAAITGIKTVTKFRPADMAVGGTGAPIEEFLDYIQYKNIAPVLTLNIGGIANIHAIHKDINKVMAFDVGPGNILIDRLSRDKFGKEYDKDGNIALYGKINNRLLDELMAHPFLSIKPPKCAWREDFNDAFLRKILRKYSHVNINDIMTTITEFTVKAILGGLKWVPYMDNINTIIGNGGGLLNKYIVNSLRSQLPEHIKLIMSDYFGIPIKANEAAKFGALALATINNIPANFPNASGATKMSILGKVSYPPL